MIGVCIRVFCILVSVSFNHDSGYIVGIDEKRCAFLKFHTLKKSYNEFHPKNHLEYITISAIMQHFGK